MRVAVGTHGLRQAHVRSLFEQRVVEQIADVDEQRSDDNRLPDEDEERADERVFHHHDAGGERDVRDQRHRHATDLSAGEAPAPPAPDGRGDHPGRAALQERLKYRERGEVVDPVARRNVRRQAGQRAREADQGLGHAEAQTSRDAEHQAVDRLREIVAVGQKECGQGLERLLDHGHEQAQDQQRADAYGRPVQRVGGVLERVVDQTLEEGDDDPDHDTAADRESEH